LIVDRQLVDELTVCLGWCRLDGRFTSFTVDSERSAWAGADGRRSTVVNGRRPVWASQQIGRVPFDNCTANHVKCHYSNDADDVDSTRVLTFSSSSAGDDTSSNVKPGDNSNGRNSAHNAGVNFGQDSHAVSSSSTGGTDTSGKRHRHRQYQPHRYQQPHRHQ